MNRKLIPILSFLLLKSALSYSQLDNIKQFVDDSGWKAASDIIKTDLYEIMQADVPIIWEHKFKSGIALQGGFGLLMHDKYKPFIQPIMTTALYPELKGGFSLFVQPVFYGDSFESFHLGIPVRYKRHGDQVSSIEVGLVFGRQWLLSRHLSLSVDVGVGENYEYSLDGKSYIYNQNILDPKMAQVFPDRIVFPVLIQMGYVL